MNLSDFYHPTHPLFELQLECLEGRWALRLTERWCWRNENRPWWQIITQPVLLPPWNEIDRRARNKRARVRAECLLNAMEEKTG